MSRYEPDGTMTVIGAWNRLADSFRAAAPWRLAAGTLGKLIAKTGEPARIDDFADVPGDSADPGRDTDIGCAAGAPIVVNGKVWRVMATGSAAEPLPPDVEDRLAGFTELVATAISTTQAREDLRRLADEQAALRRVATLVAHGAMPEQVLQRSRGK